MARTALFKKNYDLIKILAPEMLENPDLDYFFRHKSKISHLNNASIEWGIGENILKMGTFYYYDFIEKSNNDGIGDTINDPSIDVLIDNELGIVYSPLHPSHIRLACTSMQKATIQRRYTGRCIRWGCETNSP